MLQKQNISQSLSKYKTFQENDKKKTAGNYKNQSITSVSVSKSTTELHLPNELIYHPGFRYLMGTVPSYSQFKKFVTYFYQGLYYSVCNLKGPSEEYIRKKSIKLPEKKDSNKKFLMLDLDQTLIHSVFTNEQTDVAFTCGEDAFKFNVRPHCLSFLQKISEHYDIYIFTASTQDYALPIIQYLNRKKKTILGALTRKHCMETNNGFRIKDLRIIKNRSLNDLILVDNLVHSFGLQIENGIPILDFTNNKEDKELLGLQKLLIEMKNFQNVREFLQNKLALRNCLELNDQEIFTEVKEFGWKKLDKSKI